jgi:hypothetical protein
MIRGGAFGTVGRFGWRDKDEMLANDPRRLVLQGDQWVEQDKAVMAHHVATGIETRPNNGTRYDVGGDPVLAGDRQWTAVALVRRVPSRLMWRPAVARYSAGR